MSHRNGSHAFERARSVLIPGAPPVHLFVARGEVFVSEDAGRTWRQAASGLGRIACLRLTS